MLDVTDANQLTIATGMGKSRNERLADQYLEAAGIAAVWINEAGQIGMADKASTDLQPGRVLYCCAGADLFPVVMTLKVCFKPRENMRPAVIASLIELAAERAGIGITSHAVIIDRAMVAVHAVNATIAEMQSSGGMKPINRAFKEARKADPSLRYHDYLHRHKTAMLETMAREISR